MESLKETSPTNRIEYLVLEKSFETPNTANLILMPKDCSVKYRAGQFITFIFDHLSTSQVRRSYSISSTPEIDEHLRITVQKIPNGLVSRYLVDEINAGGILFGLHPAGRFVLPDPAPEEGEVFLIGGGSGFTPLYSLLRNVLFQVESMKVKLILANSTPERILFDKDLFDLIKKFENRLQVQFVISQSTNAFEKKCDQISNAHLYTGRVSNALIEYWIQSWLKSSKEHHPLFYVCGPIGLKLKTIPVIRLMGFDEARIFEEDFVIKEPFRPAASLFQDTQVKLTYHERSYVFQVPAGKNILESALENGIDLPYNCRSGICTTCGAVCRQGKAIMYGQDTITDTEMTYGDILTCVAYPTTHFLEIEIF